ncbi:hypothetical protein CANARDRAFT_23310 [[Candida] arabinofermentans NRRL YB-2248]|uniref:Protein kinase domain-containing protein n=1 Tax=[Candida] arabinofermentans NRRL YB-2248 TaxID=983967 RepID=A0A1E4T0F0_9ASCO|nr:hypothetical protein CANARDRAFT_23310 [[Candida] arabinofermentans NRRL YB-2248]
MSVVKYDGENKHLTVIHQNLSSNSLVLFNSLTNDLELVDLNSHSQYNRRRSSTSIPTFQFSCPNCGYQCDLPIPESTNTTTTNTTSTDVNSNDYFKLLSQIESNNDANNELKSIISNQQKSSTSKNNSIPLDLINQGYFKKFFKTLNVLGNGSNGLVLKVEHKLFHLNLGIFAIKKIPIGNDMNNLIKILNEVQFLYNLTESEFSNNNCNIVKYNHVWIEVDKLNEFGPKVPIVFILFEYCDGGTLEDFINSITNPKFDLKREKLIRKLKKQNQNITSMLDTKKRFLNNFEIFKIFKDILNGLNYLHDLKILHRDLKPSNCLFKNKFTDTYNPPNCIDDLTKIPNLLVSDFGESIMENTKRNQTGYTGTLEYCAPELFKVDHTGKFNEFSLCSDVYSLGIILYFICFNKLPFISNDQSGIKLEILNYNLYNDINNVSLKRGMGDDCDCELYEEWIELIKVMIDPMPENRPTCTQLFKYLEKIEDKLRESTQDTLNEINVDVDVNVNVNDVVSYKDTFVTADNLITFASIMLLLSNLKMCDGEYKYIANLQYLQFGIYVSQHYTTLRNYLILYQVVLFFYFVYIKFSN